MSLLELDDVRKRFALPRGRGKREYLHALDGVSLAVEEGETLGIVGESGCGKSTLGRCIVRLHAPTSGRVVFDGDDVARLGGRRLRSLRRDVAMVFQDPTSSLNPRRSVGDVVGDPLVVHGVASRRAARTKAGEMLERVGLRGADVERYPHEFSGGQRQRIGIARALITGPKLLVCDEPVSALDVSIQAQILNLVEDLRDELQLTCVFIAHDLSVVRHVSDRIAVMYLGRVVECGPTDDLFNAPAHPYTRALLDAIPLPDPTIGLPLPPLQGDVPSPIRLPQGCRFASRCPRADDVCRVDDPTLEPAGAPPRLVACHHPAA